MSTRKIKDAKDLSTNELIYFKGHAQATYMSDGTTVEDAINNIEVGYVTKEELNSKQDAITDLEVIRQGAAKGATALQTETYKGTVTGVKVNGTTKNPSNGVVDLGTVITSHQDISGKQDKLVSGTNIKTINGESLLGSGDIVISGGDSSSGSGAYSEVNHGTSDTTFTLTPNTFHVWEEVTELNLDFGEEIENVANEYLFQFTSNATATTLTLPDNIKWSDEFTIETNKIYQISILNGLGTVMNWEFAPNVILITFYYSGSPYSAEKGMTWEQWCNSIYNSTTLNIVGDGVMAGTTYPIRNSSGLLVHRTDVIIENENYNRTEDGGVDEKKIFK